MNDTTTTTARCRTRLYTVEGWKGMDCLHFRTGNQVRSVARVAAHEVLDLGADRVIVHREGEAQDAATWAATGGWKFGPNVDPRLVTALEEGGL